MTWPDTNCNKHYQWFVCEKCGKEFPGNGGESRFCSAQCWRKFELEGDWSVYVRVGKYHFRVDNRGYWEYQCK